MPYNSLTKLENDMKDSVQKHAEYLIRMHIPGWKFVWSNAKQRIGQCNYANKTISLSKGFLPQIGFDGAEQTLLHEIAHALTPRAKHGPIWKAKAKELGVKELRATAKGVKALPGKWHKTCKVCGSQGVKGYHRRIDISSKYHVACGVESRLAWMEKK